MSDNAEEIPFVTSYAEESGEGLVTSTSPMPEEQHQNQHQRGGSEETKDGCDVAGLIPLCVRHAEGPQINSAVFGYDIAQMRRRPWDDPAANPRDYFNYGFNETSWRVYCAMQVEGETSLLARANNFLGQLNGAAAKGGSADEAVRGDGAPFYLQPQGSSHAYYATPRDNFLKTKLCQRFAEGRCVKGSSCSYAHGHGELRTASHVHHHHHQHHQHHQHQQHHQHHQHHQHQHHQQQQAQQQLHQHPPSYILPPFEVDQGVLSRVDVPSAGIFESNVASGNYHVVTKRQRSSDNVESQLYEAQY